MRRLVSFLAIVLCTDRQQNFADLRNAPCLPTGATRQVRPQRKFFAIKLGLPEKPRGRRGIKGGYFEMRTQGAQPRDGLLAMRTPQLFVRFERRARACVTDCAGGSSLFARDAVAAAGLAVFARAGRSSLIGLPTRALRLLGAKLRLPPIRSGPYSLLPFPHLAFCCCACGAFGSVPVRVLSIIPSSMNSCLSNFGSL
jgi:hypothetical protein